MLIMFGKEMRAVDLWNTLQNLRSEKMAFISSKHCYNCGLIASLECQECDITLCSEECGRELHNTEISTKKKCIHIQ